ncbi:MAG: dihydropteroate synthase [Chloroflexota bacterium]
MLVIGESIHIIAPRVRQAIDSRDKKVIQELAKSQVDAGAHLLDLNIGPQRRSGPEVMSWMVEIVQEVVDVPLSLDSLNPAAVEAGLKLCRRQALINSTDASPDRLRNFMPMAVNYKTDIIALTLSGSGLPTSAEARVQLATENILPAAAEYGVAVENIYFDPLVLTVNGNQDQTQASVEAVRFFKQMTDPPPKTTCGLSNVSNGAPKEIRPLINRVYVLMLMGAGLDSAIMDALDRETMEAIAMVQQRDTTTPLAQLYLSIFDCYAQGVPWQVEGLNTSTPQLQNIVKTIEMLENRTLYAHSYLRV